MKIRMTNISTKNQSHEKVQLGEFGNDAVSWEKSRKPWE